MTDVVALVPAERSLVELAATANSEHGAAEAALVSMRFAQASRSKRSSRASRLGRSVLG